MKIKRIESETANQIIDSCRPLGLFYYKDANGRYIALDTMMKDYTEIKEFETYASCMSFINEKAYAYNRKIKRIKLIKKLFGKIAVCLAISGGILFAGLMLFAPLFLDKVYYICLTISLCLIALAFFIYIIVYGENKWVTE